MDAFKHFDTDNSGFITSDELHVSGSRPATAQRRSHPSFTFPTTVGGPEGSGQ